MRHRRVTRRDFLTTSALAGAGLLVAPGLRARGARAGGSRRRPRIEAGARWRRSSRESSPPVFPDRVFPVTDYGAVGDGARDCSAAFRQAIAACAGAGGGRVLVPDGRFLTGAIHLRSRVNLHLSDGATIAFSRNPDQYLPVVFTRWEGVELMNYSALIYAFEQRDIAITGKGTLDGQASDEHWWPWKGSKAVPPEATQMAARARLIEMGARGVPVADRVFGDGSRLRPNFIQPYRCQNVLIDGVTIVNSPMWEIHPVLCRNVTVRNVTINSHGPNNDGCDPESCRDVLIEGCTFDTGDDCIALKSGRNEDGRRLAAPIENVVIRNCAMKDGHGGVVIGSEVSGGARNIFAEQCRMDSPNLDRALRIKTNSVRGGFVEHVYMRDVTVGQVAEAVVTINLFYEEGDTGKFPPAVREIDVRNVTSGKSQHALLLRGYAHTPMRDIRVTDCTFDNVAKDDVIEGVTGLTLTNVRVNGKLRNETIAASAGIGLGTGLGTDCESRRSETLTARRTWLYQLAVTANVPSSRSPAMPHPARQRRSRRVPPQPSCSPAAWPPRNPRPARRRQASGPGAATRRFRSLRSLPASTTRCRRKRRSRPRSIAFAITSSGPRRTGSSTPPPASQSWISRRP